MIELKLTEAQLAIVFDALGKQPLSQVLDVFVAIRSQVQAHQVRAAAPMAGKANGVEKPGE